MTRIGGSIWSRLFGRAPAQKSQAAQTPTAKSTGVGGADQVSERAKVEQTDGFARDGALDADQTANIAPTDAAPASAGATAAHSPQGMAAKLDQSSAEDAAVAKAEVAAKAEADRVQGLCDAFLADRHALDDDPSVEWVEGWHGVHQHNVAQGVPGILDDQGLFVNDTVFVRGAYWHKHRPEPPDTWRNSGAMVHFRVPKLYLESQGKFVDHPVNGQIFRHGESVGAPRSSSNPNQELMPAQVLEVYWVRGKIPETCKDIGVDMIGAKGWPDAVD